MDRRQRSVQLRQSRTHEAKQDIGTNRIRETAAWTQETLGQPSQTGQETDLLERAFNHHADGAVAARIRANGNSLRITRHARSRIDHWQPPKRERSQKEAANTAEQGRRQHGPVSHLEDPSVVASSTTRPSTGSGKRTTVSCMPHRQAKATGSSRKDTKPREDTTLAQSKEAAMSKTPGGSSVKNQQCIANLAGEHGDAQRAQREAHRVHIAQSCKGCSKRSTKQPPISTRGCLEAEGFNARRQPLELTPMQGNSRRKQTEDRLRERTHSWAG